jgi:hypothetical protein
VEVVKGSATPAEPRRPLPGLGLRFDPCMHHVVSADGTHAKVKRGLVPGVAVKTKPSEQESTPNAATPKEE